MSTDGCSGVIRSGEDTRLLFTVGGEIREGSSLESGSSMSVLLKLLSGMFSWDKADGGS